ncbi:MAG: hypothetical protein AB1414_03370 [bacterium]
MAIKAIFDAIKEIGTVDVLLTVVILFLLSHIWYLSKELSLYRKEYQYLVRKLIEKGDN